MKFFIPTVLLAVFALSSCSTRYYAPALYQNDIQYMVKPHSKDSVRTRFYASGTFFDHGGANGQGEIRGGLLNIYRSHTIKDYNFSYGAIAYTGSYKRGMDDSIMTPPSKTLRGYGFNGSASFYSATKITDWRFGIDLSYIHETGDYLAFRRSVIDVPGVNSSGQNELWGLGVFSEFIIRLSEDFNFGMKFFLNNTLNSAIKSTPEIGSGNMYTVGDNISLGYKQFTGRMSAAFSGNFSNAAAQLGLTYRF
ncbi:MAG: hypothetical protein JKY70_10425 [Mucilaginibacter sp.]|nr:hypothetical protein [Mucilaginibacter sp.]